MGDGSVSRNSGRFAGTSRYGDSTCFETVYTGIGSGKALVIFSTVSDCPGRCISSPALYSIPCWSSLGLPTGRDSFSSRDATRFLTSDEKDPTRKRHQSENQKP